MSALDANVEAYLRLRRALGYKLERHGWLLPQFVAYLEAAGATTVTNELAIAWARLPERARPNHWAARLAAPPGPAPPPPARHPAPRGPPPRRLAARPLRPAHPPWCPAD